MRRATSVGVLIALLAWAGRGLAYEVLFARLPPGADFGGMFGQSVARASLWDGLLIGYGEERTQILPNRHLWVTQTRTYTRVRHPKTQQIVAIPEPWRVRSTFELTPSLRLVRSETTLELHRSIDGALHYALSDDLAPLFAWDRALAVANTSGNKLTRSQFSHGRGVKSQSYEYPSDAIPLEIIRYALAPAVRNRVERFDFQLLLPGGSTHGVRAEIHRTHDLRSFAAGYRVPLARVPATGELAVVDMWLASPIKHLFFPHHFYMVYASDKPEDLLAFWGGDPDETFMAIRDR